MSFVTKEWKDRLAEFAGRRKLTNVSTGEETTVDVSRAEGEVSQAGDAFSAANMNDLEQRIKDGFDKVDTNLTWKLLDSKNGVNTINLPSSFNEIIVDIYGINGYDWGFIFHLCKNQLTESEKLYITGYAKATTAAGSCSISASNSKIKFNRVTYSAGNPDGSDVSSNFSFTVYYR